MIDTAERIIPPIKSFGDITFKIMVHALIFGGLILAAIAAWHYRDVIRYRIQSAGTNDIIGLLFSETQNANYGWTV